MLSACKCSNVQSVIPDHVIKQCVAHILVAYTRTRNTTRPGGVLYIQQRVVHPAAPEKAACDLLRKKMPEKAACDLLERDGR